MVFIAPVLAAALTAATLVSAHPHLARDDPEFAKRAVFQQKARRSLGGCQSELMRRGGVYERAIARRAALAEKAREDKVLRTCSFLLAFLELT